MRKTIFVQNNYYHIYNRGVDKRFIFIDKYDSDRFFQSMIEFNRIEPIGSIFENSFKLGGSTSKLVNIIAYCLNSNHYHFILEPVAEKGIEKFMHRLSTGYTMYFNNKYKRVGALFQGRYKSKHINSNEYLLHLSVYVNLNDKAHALGGSTSELSKSSWEEYHSIIAESICKKDIILDQFETLDHYKKYAESSLESIIRNKIDLEVEPPSDKVYIMKQVILIVLDGWGYREDATHNAVAAAKTPNFNAYWNKYPHTLLEASGLAVGLPQGQMGNSEIGHTTIGAGKIIDTDLVRIGKAIQANEFISNKAFITLFDHVKKHDSILHVKGLLGTGGVHAHSEHLFAFLRAAKAAGVPKIAIHVFTDGRDAPPQSAAGYLEELEKVVEEVGIAHIATASGRFYAMDRDNNWDRVKKAEDALFEGIGILSHGKKPSQVLKELYAKEKLDEHIEPIVFLDDAGKAWNVEKNDGVFFFNFRSDRAKQLSKKIVEKKDSHNICFVTLTEYDSKFGAHVAFPAMTIETTLAAEVSRAGLTQAHIAETEKFPHATYFLNGGKQDAHAGEVHILLDSRKDVPTHDLAPKMRAEGIADKAIEEIEKGTNFIFINIANPDMVGHTANVPAIVEALEETDTQLGRIISALEKKGGVAFITADHGNAEVNLDQETGNKHTSHTTNPVPVILTSEALTFKESAHHSTRDQNGREQKIKITGGLADITPTILKLLEIPQPESMTGQSLV